MKLSIYIWLPLYIMGSILGFSLGYHKGKMDIIKQASKMYLFQDVKKSSIEDLIKDFEKLNKQSKY